MLRAAVGIGENGWLSMVGSSTSRPRIHPVYVQSARLDDGGVRGRLSITHDSVVFRPRWYRRALGQSTVEIPITQGNLCIVDLLNPKGARVVRREWLCIFTVDDSIIVAVGDRSGLVSGVSALFAPHSDAA